MPVQFTIDTSAVEKARLDLAKIPKALPGVLARSLNRANTTGRTELKRDVARRYNVIQKEVEAKMKTKKATVNDLNTKNTIDDRPLTLGNHFGTTPVAIPPRSKKKYKVKTKVFRGKSQVVQDAYLISLKGIRQVVKFVNEPDPTGKRKYIRRLKVLRSLGVSQMTASEKIFPEVARRMKETFDKRLAHETNYALKKAGFK